MCTLLCEFVWLATKLEACAHAPTAAMRRRSSTATPHGGGQRECDQHQWVEPNACGCSHGVCQFPSSTFLRRPWRVSYTVLSDLVVCCNALLLSASAHHYDARKCVTQQVWLSAIELTRLPPLPTHDLAGGLAHARRGTVLPPVSQCEGWQGGWRRHPTAWCCRAGK